MMVRKTLVAGVVVCSLAAGTALLASEMKTAKSSKARSTQEGMMAQMTKVAMPGEFHSYLKPLAGSWNIAVKTWTAPDQMEVTQGHCETSWVMNGRYLKEECNGSAEGQPYQGMGLIGYDNTSKTYVSTWIDTAGTGMMRSEGKIDPTHKIITYSSVGTHPVTGKTQKMKLVDRIVDERTRVLTSYAMRDGKESREMQITYMRTP